MQLFENIINDRGSKYSVCGAPASSKKDALNVVKALKRNKKYSKATHNTVQPPNYVPFFDRVSGTGGLMFRAW